MRERKWMDVQSAPAAGLAIAIAASDSEFREMCIFDECRRYFRAAVCLHGSEDVISGAPKRVDARTPLILMKLVRR
jgi:hypothetical protein